MGMEFRSHKPNILLSHAHLRESKGKVKTLLPLLAKLSLAGHINLLIDSGAFTAFSSGNPIPVSEYIEWCKEFYEKCAWQYIGLDVVNQPAETSKNLKAMTDAGLRPMPVQVMGERLENVRDLVEINPHICVSGGVTQPVDFMMQRYKACYDISEGKARIHGLGFVKWPQMWQVPLFSVDSSSWMQGQRWGVGCTYNPRTGMARPARLTQVIAKKQRLSPEDARLMNRRGIRPDTLTPKMYSGQSCYVAAESTTAYTNMMRHSWAMGDAGKACLFLAIAKVEDLVMVAASLRQTNMHGNDWKYQDWLSDYDALLGVVKSGDIDEAYRQIARRMV
jgi:hypothetical protein